jgi:hypothetical protein
MTYYDGTNVPISNSIHKLRTFYTDNDSLGKVLDDVSVETIVANAISVGHVPSDSNSIYFVLTKTRAKGSSFRAGKHSAAGLLALFRRVPLSFRSCENQAGPMVRQCRTDRLFLPPTGEEWRDTVDASI